MRFIRLILHLLLIFSSNKIDDEDDEEKFLEMSY